MVIPEDVLGVVGFVSLGVVGLLFPGSAAAAVVCEVVASASVVVAAAAAALVMVLSVDADGLCSVLELTRVGVGFAELVVIVGTFIW